MMNAVRWGIIGFVWAYNLVWMLVQDAVKLGLYEILDPGRSWKKSLFQPLRTPVPGGAGGSSLNQER